MSIERFGLYLHSPFCVHKCGYCDFNSWAETRIEPQKKWADSVIKSSQFWAQNIFYAGTEASIRPTSFFWGGGTPSLIDNELSEKVLTHLFSTWNFAPGSEKTIEVNPETLTEEKLRMWNHVGLNRLSMGIQSFSEQSLDLLERHARPKDNIRALEMVANSWQGKSWSLDLIFGLPSQSLEQWKADLEMAMIFSPPHISAYQLTLATERSKNWKQPPEAELEQYFDFTREFLESRGYHRYEVSNFSKPSHESEHNKNYWEVGSFLGLGPGAAGVLGREIEFRYLEPPLLDSKNQLGADFFGFHQKVPDNFEKWLGTSGVESAELKNLTLRNRKDQVYEKLMMGLRLKKGIPFWTLPVPSESLVQMMKQAWASPYFDQSSESYLRMNEKGLKILDTLLPKMFKYLEI